MGMRDLHVPRRLGFGILAGVALTGAILGSAWDLLHVRTHTTIYAAGIGRMPWWVPVEFALVYVAGVAGIERLGRPAPDGRSVRRLAGETVWLTIVYATTAVAHRYELFVVIAAAAALLVRSRTVRPLARANPVPAVAIVVAGPAVESILIASGVFRYTHASLGNIPLWLPLLYANAVPFAIRLTEAAMAIARRRARAEASA
jgi:hypothetical protein